MKKIALLMLLALVFASCSKDDDDDQNLKNHPILGIWALADYEANIETNNPSLTQDLKTYLMDEYLDDNSFELGSTITFNKNGKVVMESFNGEIVEMTFSISGSTLTMKSADQQATLIFEIRDDKLYCISDEMPACKRLALNWGYGESVTLAEFVETFIRL